MTAWRAAYGLGVRWEPCTQNSVSEVGVGVQKMKPFLSHSAVSFLFFLLFFCHAAACLVWIRAPALRLNVSACKCGNRPTRRGRVNLPARLWFRLLWSAVHSLWWPPPPVLCVCARAHVRALIDLSLGLIFRSGKSQCHLGYSGARFWKGSRR